MSGVIKVPAAALEGAQRFAIDFGGSVLKLVYIKKDDVHPEGFKLVHLQSFARADCQQAFDFIKAECDIPTEVDGELREYLLTGIGTHQFQKDLKEQLNIGVSTVWEMTCFEESFKLLIENLPSEDLYYSPEYVDDGSSGDFADKISKLVEEMDVGAAKKYEAGFSDTSDSDKWPCIMGILGSAFGFIKLNEDGTKEHGSSSPHGGRTFLGLGSLLTGAKTYKELMDLAEKGTDKTINCYISDMVEASGKGETENMYGKFAKLDANCFSFGWCVGKGIDDFKREDLARALLANTCNEIVSRCLQICEKLKVSRVVLVGGFAQAPLARKLIEEYFMKAAAVMKAILPDAGVELTCQTMRAGSYLGALGAMLLSANKTSATNT